MSQRRVQPSRQRPAMRAFTIDFFTDPSTLQTDYERTTTTSSMYPAWRICTPSAGTMNGNGVADTVFQSDGTTEDIIATTANRTAYAAAFPNPAAGMGCAVTCSGYELTADLTFGPGTPPTLPEQHFRVGAHRRRFQSLRRHLRGQRPYHPQPVHRSH